MAKKQFKQDNLNVSQQNIKRKSISPGLTKKIHITSQEQDEYTEQNFKSRSHSPFERKSIRPLKTTN